MVLHVEFRPHTSYCKTTCTIYLVVGIWRHSFWTSMGLGRQIVKELDLKLTLGMAERQLTESPPDEESWGEGQWFKSESDPKSPSLGVWLFLVQSVTVQVEHSSDVKQRPKIPFSISSQIPAGLFWVLSLNCYTCSIFWTATRRPEKGSWAVANDKRDSWVKEHMYYCRPVDTFLTVCSSIGVAKFFLFTVRTKRLATHNSGNKINSSCERCVTRTR